MEANERELRRVNGLIQRVKAGDGTLSILIAAPKRTDNALRAGKPSCRFSLGGIKKTRETWNAPPARRARRIRQRVNPFYSHLSDSGPGPSDRYHPR